MNINFDSFKENAKEVIEYNEDKNLLNTFNHSSIIESINLIKGEIVLEKVNGILIANFDLKANLDVISSYTLNPFNKDFFIKDTLYLTNDKNYENNEVIYVESNFVLEDIIYSLLLTNIPINIHQENEKIEENEEFHVYSEDELEKEREEDGDSPFDKLKDLEF